MEFEERTPGKSNYIELDDIAMESQVALSFYSSAVCE